MDRDFSHQQNLRGRGLRVLIIRAPSNRMVLLRPLVDGILQTLAAMSPGQLREVGGWATVQPASLCAAGSVVEHLTGNLSQEPVDRFILKEVDTFINIV